MKMLTLSALNNLQTSLVLPSNTHGYNINAPQLRTNNNPKGNSGSPSAPFLNIQHLTFILSMFFLRNF